MDGLTILAAKARVKMAGNPVVSYVPTASLDSIRRHGLLSGEQLSKRPRLLAAAAKARGESTADLRTSIEDVLGGWKPDSARGPNVLFQAPPDSTQLAAKHPFNLRPMSPVQVDLDALLRDVPGARLHGQELMPYAKYKKKWTAEQLAANEDDPSLRHRDLSPTELRGLRRRSAMSLWSKYRDDENRGLYAPDVPHAAVITPDGRIDPKYLKFGADAYNLSTYLDHADNDPLTRIDAHDQAGANVGYLTSHPSKEPGLDYTWLKGMKVSPAHRGRGIAGLLLDEAIRANAGKELRLRARPYAGKPLNQAALQAMYARRGFSPYDDEGRMVRPAVKEGHVVDEFLLLAAKARCKQAAGALTKQAAPQPTTLFKLFRRRLAPAAPYVAGGAGFLGGLGTGAFAGSPAQSSPVPEPGNPQGSRVPEPTEHLEPKPAPPPWRGVRRMIGDNVGNKATSWFGQLARKFHDTYAAPWRPPQL